VRELKNAVERSVIMARGDRIALNDIMPRHLRGSGEVPTSVTLHVGASMADARRRLVLSTLASNNGDVDRAARTLGLTIGDVRHELETLLSGGGTSDDSSDDDLGAARAPRDIPTRAASAPKKPTAKKK
jgi:DNA-binding NtrC family response regulator